MLQPPARNCYLSPHAPPARARDMTRHTAALRRTTWATAFGWWLVALTGCGGCGGSTATVPAPGPTPVPTTVRPLVVPDGAEWIYEVHGKPGLLDHPESGRQQARPDRFVLRGTGDQATLIIEVGKVPPGQKPKLTVPPRITATIDPVGIVRLPGAGSAHVHKESDPDLGARVYATIANILLLRPTKPAPADAQQWEDVTWFAMGDADWPARLYAEPDGTATLGGRSCERWRWHLEALTPEHYLGSVQYFDAAGLTFYDPAAKQIVAAEAEFRLADRPNVWGFIRWEWLSISLPEVHYDGHEMDGTWIDGAFTVHVKPPGPKHNKRIQENTAIKRVYGIHKGQELFRKDVRVDVDQDGKGEYGFLPELAGIANLRTPGGLLGPRVPFIRGASYTKYGVFDYHGRTNAAGVSRGDNYCWLMVLAGADGPLRAGVKPPDGDARHADAQEVPGGWSLFGWPDTGADATLVLHVDSQGVIRGTYDLKWRGPDGGPAKTFLARPEDDGVTWKARTHTERIPPTEAEVVILAKNVDVPQDCYLLLARHRSNLIKLQMPDLFATLPRGTEARVREQELRWRKAWRDRRVSTAELEPIVAKTEALLSGRAGD